MVATQVRTTSRSTEPVSGRPREKSNTKLVLYVVAGVLSLVVFVVPLLWALMRSLQPNDTITAVPDASTFFKLTFANFRGIAADGHIPRAVSCVPGSRPWSPP